MESKKEHVSHACLIVRLFGEGECHRGLFVSFITSSEVDFKDVVYLIFSSLPFLNLEPSFGTLPRRSGYGII